MFWPESIPTRTSFLHGFTMSTSVTFLLSLSFVAFNCDNVNAAQNSKFLPSRTECGYQEEDRIYGGQITDIGEYPWMVLLRYKFTDDTDAGFKCGGTLISKRYVLTAAHCISIDPLEEIFLDIVRIGEWRISTKDDCEEGLANEECADPVIDIKIQKEIPHSDYKRRNIENDVGLLRLERNVEFTHYVRPICLPESLTISKEVGTIFVISGWGATENGSFSDIKLKLEVPLVALSECVQKVRTRGRISENHICAGGEYGKDACQGDSGGPLMSGNKISSKTQWTQEGIVSYGNGCGRKGRPAVYTRVAKYMDWILNNLEES